MKTYQKYYDFLNKLWMDYKEFHPEADEETFGYFFAGIFGYASREDEFLEISVEEKQRLLLKFSESNGGVSLTDILKYIEESN